MTDLQASVDFSVELGAFYNLDLFQRGYYQIRVGLKSLTNRVPCKVTCHAPKSNYKSNGSVNPAHVEQGIGVSQTFPILYKNEDLLLNDVFRFTVELLVDCHKIQDCLDRAGLKLIIELWFSEEYEGEDKMEVVSCRIYDLHYTNGVGLHVHVAVIFDYFHFAAVCMTVHAALIALHQPIYNPKNPSADWPLKNGQMSTLEQVLFTSHSAQNAPASRLRSANHTFRQICKVLLTSHEVLQTSLQKLAKRLQSKTKKLVEPDYKDCFSDLEKLCKFMEGQEAEDEFLSYATSKIAHLCAYNVVLWQTYIELFTFNVRAIKILAKDYHQGRVKRFSEAFFTQEWQKKDVINCYEPSKNGHSDLTAVVRNSSYFNNTPPLAVHNQETDGDRTNLPIIFEDIYQDESTSDALVFSSEVSISPSPSTLDLQTADDRSQKSESRSPQIRIKNSMSNMNPASTSKMYSMTEEILVKKDEKEVKNTANPRLVGFKRLSVNNETEPYELGCLSPSAERMNTLGLHRRKSLLMSERRKRVKGQSSNNETSDNFSLIIGDDSSLKSGSSGGSSNETSSSPKLEKSFNMNGRVTAVQRSETSSPLLRRGSQRKKKSARPQTASVMNKSETVNGLSQLAPSSNDCVENLSALLDLPNRPLSSSQSVPQMKSRKAVPIDQNPDRTRSSQSQDMLAPPVSSVIIEHLTQKEKLKARLAYSGHLYSDFANLASDTPYFFPPTKTSDKTHLIICVHGLEGNSQDLRLVKQYLELALPYEKFEFLMSSANVEDTYLDIAEMGRKLSAEIIEHVASHSNPHKISIISHSLGNVIVRAALTDLELLSHIQTKLHTFLSLSGPHVGTIFSDSNLVNMAMWVITKWKKTGSIIQLALKDNPNPRETFIYKLSQKPGLEYFKNVLLVSSHQDKYVPYHSARIEVCKAAQKDDSPAGKSYIEMVHNILRPLIEKPALNLIRYDTFYTLPTNTNSMIGRAAHIAALDSELFIEKFLLVTGSKYFKIS